MEAVFQSFLLIFVSEIGDKTQLLALVLAARFRKPWAIMAGILVATVLNHGLASYLGLFVSEYLTGRWLNWILAAVFFISAIWILIPEKADGPKLGERYGAFLTSAITFFLTEMGDKTQLATMALSARFQAPLLVTIGATLGILASDGLVVAVGGRLPMRKVHYFAAVLFVAFGIYILWKN